ncbi:MAG: hypothetical protein XD95_0388 [Microgenomates bacterium 39_7]|nr:MAG: hypothetical protein XD95_0388 [Microgenomates bacterium 39_7]
MPKQQSTQIDGYYSDDELILDDELDLSFLDEDEE